MRWFPKLDEFTAKIRFIARENIDLDLLSRGSGSVFRRQCSDCNTIIYYKLLDMVVICPCCSKSVRFGSD